MWKDKSSIQTKFLNKMIFIVLVSIGLWCLIWIQDEYSSFNSESESLRAKHIQSQKSILKKEVVSVVNYINDIRKQAEHEFESALKERVNEACQIAMNIYQQNIDSKDFSEIKTMIRDALRPIRFNGGRGYYFVVSMDGVGQLYPDRPGSEGNNLIGLQDSKGNSVIQDAIELIKKSGEGFLKHFWTKPGKDPSIMYPKICYIKYFKPLDWYLGTGEYLEEAKKQVQHELLNRIVNLRFGTEGYFFGSTYQGDCLFSNGKITIGSGNIWNLTDPNGVKIIHEQRKIIENSDGGFIHYSWNKLNTSTPSPKISFVQGIPEWGWMIGAGTYLDTIEKIILKHKAALNIRLKRKIIRSISILAVLLCLVYFWSKRISIQIQKVIDTFSSFLKKASIESITINPDTLQLKEFKDIAVLTNKMLKDRRQAEEALRESEKHYRHLFNVLPYGAELIDPKGNIIDCNPNTARMLGYERDELIGKHITTILDAESIENFRQKFPSIMKGNTEQADIRMVHRDGTRIDVIRTGQPIYDTDGTVSCLLAVNINVTERKQAEEELKKLSVAIRQSPVSIVITDPEGNIEYVNPKFCKLTGYSDEDVLGKNPRILKSGKTPGKTYEQLWETILAGEKWRGEFQNKKKTGELYWEDAVISPIFNENGDIIHFLAVKEDITEKKQIETALVKSEKQFQNLFASITDLIYTQDMEGRFISVNPAMNKLFGYDTDDFLGRRAIDFMEPEFQSDFDRRYLEVVKKKGYHEGTACYFKKNGEKVYLEYKSSLVRPVDGESYISGIARDVTEKVLSGKKLKKLRKRVAHAQRMESIGTLAGGIAHDFNNILFPIVGHTEMLLEDVAEDSPFRPSLNEIYAGALRAKDLVKQILTFSRQDRNEPKLMRIQPVIKEILKFIRSSIPTSIDIKQKVSTDCGVIKADPTQIHQIIMNLVINAYHAMEDTGGEMRVSLKEIELSEQGVLDLNMEPGIYACLTVADTGIGMDKELVGKIFDPFFTTKEKGKGTGMGLSVVHGIVNSMGGSIRVYSEPEKGTEFHVYFPVEKSSVEKQNFIAEGPVQEGIERILLVDDEEMIVTMGKHMLERLGYQVTSRTSSIEALEAFRNNPEKFDMVITDMTMPNMPGDKLAVELTKIRPDISILLCTGFSETMSEEKAASLGIKGFILKPIVMKDFSQKIREVLDGK
jgi:nitrogen fixation negative regulator NifL